MESLVPAGLDEPGREAEAASGQAQSPGNGQEAAVQRVLTKQGVWP